MMRTLRVLLLTLGDPGRLTGGYLYHRRMADLAARNEARLAFLSFPERPFPLGLMDAPRILRRGRQLALLCVGNWVTRKGIHSLLEAVASLPENALTLHLAGDDRAEPAYAARLHARIAQADLAERVVVHGPLSLEQVAA